MSGWTEITLAAAFLAGLTGSLHCAAMCGPLLGLVCGHDAEKPAHPRRLAGALAYNAGRITSYCIAGAATGAVGSAGLALRGGPSAQHAMLIATSAALLMLAAYIAGWTAPARGIESAGRVIWRRIEPFSRQFLPANTPARTYALGLVWGWLPCGMVYVALIAAISTADPLQGALLMAAFGVGTLPSMLAVSLWGRRLVQAAKSRFAQAAIAAIIAATGIVMLARALHPADVGWCISVPTLTQFLRDML